jgi:tetratricopeptide (TPR) repeat protein
VEKESRSENPFNQSERKMTVNRAREQLSHYHLAHPARADLCRRLGRILEARASYEKALALAPQEPDRPYSRRNVPQFLNKSSSLLSIFPLRDDYRMKTQCARLCSWLQDR